MTKVVVTATSFAKNQRLRDSCRERFPGVDFDFCDPHTIWSSNAIAKAIAGGDYWVVGKEPVNAVTTALAKGLKGVSKYGVGLDNIDFDFAKKVNFHFTTNPV